MRVKVFNYWVCNGWLVIFYVSYMYCLTTIITITIIYLQPLTIGFATVALIPMNMAGKNVCIVEIIIEADRTVVRYKEVMIFLLNYILICTDINTS